MAEPEDIEGALGDLLRWGRIASVDLDAGKVVVDLGDLATQPMPWLSLAGGIRSWVRPKVGEQVLVVAPEGEIAAGVALRGLWCDAFPVPGGKDTDYVLFEDGAQISYDPVAHVLRATLPAAGKIQLVAPGGVTIDGPLKVTGTATFDDRIVATGEVISQADVKVGTVSLKTHRHIGVTAGAALSGAPE